MRNIRFENMAATGRQRGEKLRDGCSVIGCETQSVGGKSFCIEHIEQATHAKRVIDTRIKRAKELSMATKPNGWRNIDVHGSRAQEIIARICLEGAISPSNLANRVELGRASLDAYLMALEAAGLVKVEKIPSIRGGIRRVVTVIKHD